MKLDALDTRERLAVVAVKLFSEKGYTGTSIRDIAKAMGMSISNIYHYSGSKEGVFMEALRRAVEMLLKELRFVSDLDLPPIVRIKLMIERHLRYVADNNELARIFVIELLQDVSSEALLYSKNSQKEIYAIYKKEFDAIEQTGAIHGRDVTAIIFGIFGVINWFARWYKPGGRLTRDEAIGQALGFIWRGSFGGTELEAANATPGEAMGTEALDPVAP
ncbi:MAG: TetR/AcrR family transcriptional regulator [Deltaproteobacteria bacterium]|nr:TetR/AcrR family transcriptional regulator [Deltaproteobacteria bacterium]